MRKKQQWIMTALTLLLCAAVCASILSLYRAGYVRHASSGPVQPIFTWEETVAQIRYLLPVAVLWLLGAFFCKAEQTKNRPAVRPEKQRTPASSGRLRLLLLIFALAFIALGVLNGGLHDVLVKAIQICTECIGLG
ncbi:MAG: hypothetical protein IJ664_01105 [Clostridia bacterium]|nr:hypothetical protein [Clostridia bacterium]